MLRDVEGLGTDVICDSLKISENQLFVRLHRARERVRQAVENALADKPPRDVSHSGLASLLTMANAIRRKSGRVNGI